jgi:hypothetical protein
MSEMSEGVDYDTLGRCGTTYDDLYLWATLTGQHALAAKVWLRAKHPLRIAVIACRVVQKLGERKSDVALKDVAREYEECAVGVLDTFSYGEAAEHLLMVETTKCTVPTPAGTFSRNVPLWSGSVLDEATKDDFPCLSFVSHPHCEAMLLAYFAGDYIGSKACIPHDATLLQVAGQIVIQSVQAVCLGLLPPKWTQFIMRVRTPRFRLEHDMVSTNKAYPASSHTHDNTDAGEHHVRSTTPEQQCERRATSTGPFARIHS